MEQQENAKEYKILFVCLGNICRSPAAQGVLQRMVDERGLSSKFFIDSAGTYGGHAGQLPDDRMRAHAGKRGYKLTHRARRIVGCDLEDFDLIVGMDATNVSNVCRLAATVHEADKVVAMGKFITQFPHYDHVPDPYYEGAEGFELVLDLLEDACKMLLEWVLEKQRNHKEQKIIHKK